MNFGIDKYIGQWKSEDGYCLDIDKISKTSALVSLYKPSGKPAIRTFFEDKPTIQMPASYEEYDGIFLIELWKKGKKQKLQRGMEFVYKYSFIVMIPVAMTIFSYPKLVLKLLFGPEYIQASPVLQILAIGAIIYTVAFVNNNTLSGIGYPKINTKIILTAAVFNILSNIVLIPKLGITGAAITTVLSYLIILVLSSYHIRRFIKIKIPWGDWASCILGGLIFVVIIN